MKVKALLLLPVASLALAGCPNDGNTNNPTPPPKGPPPTQPTQQQYSIITGQKHDIGLGVYEYKLFLDDPKGDRWVSVSKKQYENCMDSPSDTYPRCAGF